MDKWLSPHTSYVRDLVGAGLDGVASAWKQSAGSRHNPARAGALLAPAAFAVSAGVLGACLNRKRSVGSRLAMAGLAGSALGFGAAVAWASHGVTKSMLTSARREVDHVRDSHWLEKNPITYA